MTEMTVGEAAHPHIHDNPHPHFTRIAHALLRIVTGLLFMQHGVQKLFGLLGGMGQSGGAAEFGTLMWVAGILETFGGLLIALGAFTRPVAFLLSGEMAVAYFKVHFPQNFWPLLNRGEVVVLFCFIYLYFAAAGAGGFSIHALRRKRSAT
jgi:putative oxidoreductase